MILVDVLTPSLWWSNGRQECDYQYENFLRASAPHSQRRDD